MKRKIRIASALILASVIFYGCGWPLKIEPIPELKIGSPLSEIEPLTFVVNEFEDVRPDKIAIGGNQYGVNKLHEDQKISELVAHAFVNELKRDGHRVLESKDVDKADLIINGIVRKFWVDLRSGTFTVALIASIETEINFTMRRGAEKSLLRTYRGNYYFETSGLPTSGVWRDVINQALLEMLKEFTTDEEFIKTLKSIKRKDL